MRGGADSMGMIQDYRARNLPFQGYDWHMREVRRMLKETNYTELRYVYCFLKALIESEAHR